MMQQAHEAAQVSAEKAGIIERMLAVMVWLDGRTFANVLMEFQKHILRDFLATVRRKDCASWYRRGLIHVGKKNAKTLLMILSAIILLHTDRPMGRKGCQVIYVANDKDQAAENLDFTKKLYRVNPVLADEVNIRSNTVELKSGTGYIEIVASGDADGLHGRSYRLLAFDELHAQADYRVLEALEIDSTRPDAQQLFGSYSPLTARPGQPIVDILDQHARQLDPRLYVFSRSGSIEEANPAMGGPLGSTREDIESARLRLPSWNWRRLYLNVSGQAEGAAFDGNAVESCIVRGRHALPPRDGVLYSAFCDPSGGSGHDDMTCSIGHAEDGKVIVDCVIDQGPHVGAFSPEGAVAKFAAVLRQYRIQTVTGDRYAGLWPREAFMKHGIMYEVGDLNRSQLYAHLEPLLSSGQIELPDSPKLLSQLLGLIRKGDRIDHASGEHDDHGNAVAGVASLVSVGDLAPLVTVVG